MNKKWRLKSEPESEVVEKLSRQLRLQIPLAKLLAQRELNDIKQAKSFFKPVLSDLHDPFLLKDMDKAIQRLEWAVDKDQKVIVYGDYDVDGTSAVALVYSFLRKLGVSVLPYIPDRASESPGISQEGIDFAEQEGAKLIIALDCGIKASEEVEYANSKNIDIIICDHHRPGAELPPALAILNPKRNDCDYPFKDLSGCGVGLKLIQGYCKKKGWDQYVVIKEYLDLVAMSIAADIVSVMGENRILAFYGLEKLNSNPRAGIKVFTMFSKKRQFTLSDIIFVIAPRLNAAGRINKGIHAVNLLTTDNEMLAKELAIEIDAFNNTRKKLDLQTTKQAISMLEGQNISEKPCIIVYNEQWHKGVIGIVASRLVEKYSRPSFVFTKNKDLMCASVRSACGFDVYSAIEKCEDIIEHFGGHKFAAGLSIKPENFEQFCKRISELSREVVCGENSVPEIEVDLEIKLSEIDKLFYRNMKKLSPFGPKNLNPIFLTQGVIDNGWGKSVGENTQHLKLTILDPQEPTKSYDAIGFNLGHKSYMVEQNKKFSIIYTIEENEHKGRTSLQLRIKDLQPYKD